MTEKHIPAFMREWILDISDRMQVPLSFLVVPAVISMAAVVGRQIGIFPKQKDDWLVVPNLWGAVIARPGYFKTPAIAEALKPLDELVKKAREKYAAEEIVSDTKKES